MARRRTAPTESTTTTGVIAEFVGNRDNEGRPVEFFSGIPARDLMQRDMNRLTDEQRDIVNGSHLYKMTDPDNDDGEGESGDGES